MINVQEAINRFISYMADRNNPNKVNHVQLGAYSKEKADELLDKKLTLNNFPISKYGDNSWMPPNILGSFEGGSRLTGFVKFAMNEEPNGDICMIENATNGIKSGAFYTFFTPDPTDSDNLPDTNPTPRAYAPKWMLDNFPGYRVYRVWNSEGSGCVVFMMIDDETNDRKHAIVLTNGTLDDREHTAGSLIESFQDWGNANYVLVKDKVYCIAVLGNLELRVAAANVTDIGVVDSVQFNPILDWTTTGMRDEVFERPNIRWATKYLTEDIDDPESYMALKASNIYGFNTYGTSLALPIPHPTENKVRHLHSICTHCPYNGGSLLAAQHIITEIDFDNKVASIHPSTRYPTLTRNRPTGFGAEFYGDQAVLNGLYNGVQGQDRGYFMLTTEGNLMRSVYTNTGNGYFRWRSRVPVRKHKYEMILPENFVGGNYRQKGNYRRFGSMIGGEIYLRAHLPGGYRMIDSFSSNPADPLVPPRFRQTLTYSNLPYDGFEYILDGGVKHKGFEPVTTIEQTNSVVTNCYNVLMTGKDKKITNFNNGNINSITGGTSVYTSLYVKEDGKNITTTDGKTVAIASKDVFEKSILAYLEEANMGERKDLTIEYELWIPPAGTARSYPLMTRVMAWDKKTFKAREVFFEVKATFSSGSITSGVISDLTVVQTLMKSDIEGSTTGYAVTDYRSGYIYEHFGADGKLEYSAVYPNFRVQRTYVGNSSGRRMELIILPEETSYNLSRRRGTSFAMYWDHDEARFMVDGIGPVFINRDLNVAAGGAAIFYRKRDLRSANDYQSYRGDVNDDNSYIWICAQVAEGYNVYFTDNENSLLRGVYYPVESTRMNLQDIDPEPNNKKFYVHLKLENGKVSYVITPDKNEKHNLYIGYISTNDTQIENINIVKVVTIE